MHIEGSILKLIENEDIKNGRLDNIPKEITEISSYCFANCTDLRQLIIPNGICQIGSNAFSGCVNLENIRIPNSVSSIGSFVFMSCKSLSEIQLSDNIKLNNRYFFGCPEKCKVYYRGHTYLVEDILEYY